MRLLYVDDQLVDLFPNTVIAQTLQVFDPGRIGSIVTNFTASIAVPKTRNNEITFGFISNSKTKSDIPYASLSCKYSDNGLPLIQNARVIITEVDQAYKLTIYSGPYGFFETIALKTLWDLDFLDINGPWDQSDRDGYRNTITGIVQALLDDGRIESISPPVITYQEDIIRFPQIYYHTVLEKIFDGYTFTGDIFTNDIYKKIIIPLSNIYKDPSFLEAKQFYAAADGTQVIINPVTAQTIEFVSNVKQGSDAFYDGVSTYSVVNADTANRYYRLQFLANLTIDVTGGTVDIKIESPYLDETLSNVGTGTHVLTLDTRLGDTDTVKVTLINNTGTPTVEILSGLFYSQTITGQDGFEFFPSIINEYVYFQKLFDKITILDFLKDFCVRFNCQITQINNTLHVNTMNSILDDRSGPDWTQKRDRGKDRNRWIFNNYGRTNFIKSPSDDYTENLTENYGNGSFEIPNENLREKLDIYTSIFAVTQMINTFGVFMAQVNPIPAIGPNSELEPVGKRLLFVRSKYDFEPDVLYDAIDRDDYLVAYYFDPDQTYEMSFQFFIDQFHQKFIDRCLRKVRLIERDYNLSDLDIFKFNQQVPIWDNGERFLVTKISNRVSRKVAKTELLKIESNPEHFFVQGTANNITGALEDLIEEIGNDLVPELDIEMELIEDQTGNPTWEAAFDNTEDSETLICIGGGGSDSAILDHHGVLDVDANVLKTNNDGNGPDGFPVITGYVEWLRNGVQVNTATFDSSGHSNTWGLNYTYLDVKAWEVLKVIVYEDGSIP